MVNNTLWCLIDFARKLGDQHEKIQLDFWAHIKMNLNATE